MEIRIKMDIKSIFADGEKTMSKYKNLIGLGVMFFLILLIVVFLFTHAQEKKIAEKCGFDDGKIKCVCTDQAWNKYQADLDPSQETDILTKDLYTFND